MERLISELIGQYDVVLLDSPPILAASDGAVLGAMADGVLLVVRAGRTDRAQVQRVISKLGNVNARVLGAVLNDPEAKVPKYGGYYRYEYESVPDYDHA